ncbi:unnamed protein product, partial [marine sediment metagenome]
TEIDQGANYIRYKVEIATNASFTQGVQVFDQTASQTGFSGQDAQGGTAYQPGSTAIYTFQEGQLGIGTIYFWRVYARDPAGFDQWSEPSETRSFTTIGVYNPNIWGNEIGDGIWSTHGNWSKGTAPVAGDDVMFIPDSSPSTKHNTSCAADSVNNNLGSFILDTGYTSTITFAKNAVAGEMSLTVSSDITVNSGTLVFEGDTDTDSVPATPENDGTGYTINAQNIIIGNEANMNADGKGFPQG